MNRKESPGPSKNRKPSRSVANAQGGNTDSTNLIDPNQPIDVTQCDVTTEGRDVREACCYEGSFFCDALKAIAARQLFFFHTLVTIWRVSVVSGDERYWFLTLSFSLIVGEALVVLFVRRGQEWKWFQPSVLCYIACVAPPIWLLEYDSLGYIDLSGRTQTNTNVTIHSDLFPWIQFDKRQWLQALEQSLLVLIILNRWIIPKGTLSRDSLSQLLLSQLGTACDIVDFYSMLAEPFNQRQPAFVGAVLSFWTISLLQFAIVSTAKRDPPTFPPEAEEDDDGNDDERNVLPENKEDAKSPGKRRVGTRAPLHKKVKIDDCAVAVPVATGSQVDKKWKAKQDLVDRIKIILTLLLETDAWSTLLSLLMQDLPFFLIRVTTIFGFRLLTYTNCFFATKNLLVIILQCYRVYSVTLEQWALREERRRERQNMWLVKVHFLDYPDPKRLKRDPGVYSNTYFKF